MKTTIDKAGRVVIPAEIRSRARLKPGTELEIDVDEQGIRLRRKVTGPKLVRVGKRLVAKPTMPAKDLPQLDIAELIRAERDRWPW